MRSHPNLPPCDSYNVILRITEPHNDISNRKAAIFSCQSNNAVAQYCKIVPFCLSCLLSRAWNEGRKAGRKEAFFFWCLVCTKQQLTAHEARSAH
jgi:hypothetical protein